MSGAALYYALMVANKQSGVMPAVKAVGAIVAGAVSPNVAWPAGTAAGDFALLILRSSSETVAAPSGWTQVSASPQAASTTGVQIFWKFAVGSDPAVAVASTNATYGVIVTYSGVNAASAVNVSTGLSNAASTTVTYPAATTTTANCLLVQAGVLFGGLMNARAATVPSGRIQDVLDAMAVYHAPAPTAGSYGAVASTINASNASATITIALTPA